MSEDEKDFEERQSRQEPERKPERKPEQQAGQPFGGTGGNRRYTVPVQMF
jgi:hypothetical protein